MGTQKENWKTSKKERYSYATFFLGQNMFYMFVYLYLSFYYTEVVLIPAAAVATLFLVARIWDAVNDPMMGIIVDRSKLKKGKFIPWIKLSTFLLPLACIIMFAIPSGMGNGAKIAMASITYIAFGMIYTINDAPVFALSTVMTDEVVERSTLMANGRLCATLATMLAAIFIKPIANKAGWLGAAVVVAIWGFIMMIPLSKNAKERMVQKTEQQMSMKRIFHYIKENKYLLIFLAAFLIGSSLNLATSMGTYVAKYSFGNENLVSLISLIGMLPMIVVPILLPGLMKKIDKKKILIICVAINIIFSVLLYFVGITNFMLFAIITIFRCLGLGGFTTMSYMFVADCIEYGTFQTGERAEGITFSLQTFCTKMSGAIAGAVPLFVFSLTGLNATIPVEQQTTEAIHAVWSTYTLVPAIGMIAVLLIMIFGYKLCDQDIQAMADINHGREVAEGIRNRVVEKYKKMSKERK